MATIDKNEIQMEKKEENNIEIDNHDNVLFCEINSLSQFLKDKYYNCIPIPLNKDNKRPFYSANCNFVFDWNKITTDDMWDKWEKIGKELVAIGVADVGLSLRDGMVVVDADNMEIADMFEEKYPTFNLTAMSTTRKGKHYYFKKTKEIESWTTSIRPCGNDFDFDIITNASTGTGSIIVCPPSINKVWVRPLTVTPLLTLPQEFISWIEENHNRPRKHIYQKVNENREIVEVEVDDELSPNRNRIDMDKLKKIVKNLIVNRSDNYQDWITCCWAIYNVSHVNGSKRMGKNLIHKFSQKSVKYNETTVDRFYDTIRYRPNGVGLGYLMSLLKNDNIVEFKKVVKDLKGEQNDMIKLEGYMLIDNMEEKVENMLIDIYDNITHDNCAELFCLLNKKYIYVGDDTFYEKNSFGAYTKIEPSFQKEKIEKEIKEDITPLITGYYGVMRQLLRQKFTDEEKLDKKLNALSKKYDLIVTKLGSCGFITGVKDTVKQKVLDINALTLMDENRNIVLYKNGILDLETMELRGAKEGEYVSMYMATDLIKQPKDITPNDFKDAENIINEWFDPDGIDALYFKKLCASFLQGGNRQQVGHFFIGKGSNAKSKAQEVCEKCFGDYYNNIPASVYTKREDDGQKAQPFKMNYKGKRISWANETDEKVKFETTNFHNECDNSPFETRGLYSRTIVKIKPQNKNVVGSNYLPVFTSAVKLATIRRIRVMLYKYSFLPEEDMDKNNPLHKLVNTELSDLIDNLLAEFNLMWVYYFKIYKEEGLLPTPFMIKTTREYIKTLDCMKLYVEDSIVKCGGEVVWVNDLYDDFERWCENEGFEKSDIMKKRKFINKLREDYEIVREKSNARGRRDEMYIKDCKNCCTDDAKECLIVEKDEYD